MAIFSIAEGMLSLSPEQRNKIALSELMAAFQPDKSETPEMVEAIANANKNRLKTWRENYGQFVSPLAVDNVDDTMDWQVPATQIADLISPVTSQGKVQNESLIVQNLLDYMQSHENRDHLYQSLMTKTSAENNLRL